jgi:hypothetical protein
MNPPEKMFMVQFWAAVGANISHTFLMVRGIDETVSYVP